MIVRVSLPLDGIPPLATALERLSARKRIGFIMVASLLWNSVQERKGQRQMRLVRAAALNFVDRIPGFSNPATFVATAWECPLETPGSNIAGKVTNGWGIPSNWSNRSVKVPLVLTARQHDRWTRRYEILRDCSDAANPHAAFVRKTLSVTRPGALFRDAFQRLTKKGERQAAENYLAEPEKANVTRDGEVQSCVSRLPESLRETLVIEGMTVAEFDIKSAHAVLLGMFYSDETDPQWQSEKECFDREARNGFPSIYGKDKEWKKGFLAALNQPTQAARHASPGYRELENLFPLLASKLARLKAKDSKAVGRQLRVALAVVTKEMLIRNDADGIRSIPVTDSAVIAMPSDFFQQHRAVFRTAWRLGFPIAEKTSTAPIIEGSNGEKYQFF